LRATKNVFIDSSVFIGHNFDYSSPSLKRLEELVAEGQANVFITDIVIREVESNLSKRLNDVESAAKSVTTKHPY
jgi:predicted nucleic acid-binding protein